MQTNILTALLVILGVILLYFGFSFLFSRLKKSQGGGIETKPKKPVLSPAQRRNSRQSCPICGTILKNGEKVSSVAFPAGKKGERIMHISGCPHCLYGSTIRRCPVCFGTLNQDQILVAKVTETNGKTHIRIFGCSKCGGKAAEL
jgi:C4-type Zn-finger protein